MLSAFLLATVVGAPQAQNSGWQIAKAPLVTKWSKQVSPTNALPEYPRPGMVRKQWMNLNGLWEYSLTAPDATAPRTYGGKILVPYPMESALSGLALPSAPEKTLWYRRSFTIPSGWSEQRVLLHFGAVNWDAAVTVNGQAIGSHRGGYDPFSFDVTGALRPGANEIVVATRNPLLVDVEGAQPVGKQRIKGGGIFYTAASGIWQTVWLEPVPVAHIEGLRITPDLDKGIVRIEVDSSGTAGQRIEISASNGGSTVSQTSYATDVQLRIPNPRVWTPESPNLYNLKIRLFDGDKAGDTVDGYFAMRKIALGKDEKGRTSILLNNKPVFQVGALDQGYWPDGIYTAPTDAALKWDIEEAKRLGFNLLRKHAKVEPARWYYWTDRLGMLVWQDMPQSFGAPKEGVEGGVFSEEGKAQWDAEWRRIMTAFHNYPSIVVWTPFNEGWGQHDTARIVETTKAFDPSRLVNAASGWFDKEVGDIDDVHDYPGPGSDNPTETRAAVNGEFGGVTRRIPGHMWTEDVFGYGATLSGELAVTRRYQDLLRRSYALRESKGTIAVVYTQLTDVEQESNGLVTYDRAIRKANAKIVAAANRGKFLPLPPDPNPPLVATSADEGQIWRYTTETPAADWTGSAFRDAGWRSGPGLFGHDVGGVRTDWSTGEIWLRREVTLPAKLPNELAFSVFHDEDVEIYVNGILAASATGYTGGYVELPMTPAGRAALRPGKNLIAVHCRQTRGGQAIDVGIVKRTPNAGR